MKVTLNDEYKQLYDINIYIQKNNLVLELESGSGKYSRQYNLEQLQTIDRYFKQSENIELKIIKRFFSYFISLSFISIFICFCCLLFLSQIFH